MFYLEAPWESGLLRVKYAVMSLDQFARGATTGTVQPMIWARFAQPARLVYGADDQDLVARVREMGFPQYSVGLTNLEDVYLAITGGTDGFDDRGD